ncbi:DMT family transporter [Streptomyces sp. NPDC059881]|uniref:DMT family transporter n=1 Tax=Streptomyces sp. NPDC059881 TaxID=3346986 RepID=UPI003651C7CA
MNTHIGSRSFLALMGVVVLWASAFPAIRVGVDGLGVAALSFLRLGIAAVALVVVAPFLGVRRPQLRDMPLIGLAGATGMTAYQVLLNWGEVHVSAGTASMLISVAPVFSVLLGRAFLSEPVRRNVVIGSGVAIGGSLIVALGGGDAGFSVGALVVLAAAALQGVYHVVSKPLLRRYSGMEVATYAMVAGTIFALPLLPATLHGAAGAPLGALLSAAYLALLPSAVGFVLWGYAVARLPLTISTAALYLVPPVALIVSFVWLSEIPHLLEVVGGVVIISGVVLIKRRTTKPTHEQHHTAREQRHTSTITRQFLTRSATPARHSSPDTHSRARADLDPMVPAPSARVCERETDLAATFAVTAAPSRSDAPPWHEGRGWRATATDPPRRAPQVITTMLSLRPACKADCRGCVRRPAPVGISRAPGRRLAEPPQVWHVIQSTPSRWYLLVITVDIAARNAPAIGTRPPRPKESASLSTRPAGQALAQA